MGASATKASQQQQQAAKTALANMCESVAKAILEVSKLEGPIQSEAVVTQAAKEVVKMCQEQATRSTSELARIIRTEKLNRMMSGASGSSSSSGMDRLHQKLAADLLFLELLRVALNDETGGSSSSGSGSRPSSRAGSGGDSTTIAHPWTRQEELGKGAFGAVYSAVDKNGFKFAVKEVPRDGVEEKSLRDEVKFLGQLSHRNIVKFYGLAGDKQKIYMYMELMQGSIKDRIDSSGRPIQQNMAKRYTKDLLQGLVYLHAKGVIHRDVKCANILLDRAGTAKLADMGISKKHEHATRLESADDNAGTICYVSPEVISGQEGGKRSDVWSVGCTVYEMVKGKPPFAEELPPILFLLLLPKMIQNLEHRKLVTKQDELGPTLQSFLLKIFVKMDERPFVEQLTDHPWSR